MSADDDDLGLRVPKAYRMQDHYTAVVSKNTLKKDSPFVLQVLPYCRMLYTLTFTFTENSRSFLFVSLVQLPQPKGLYVAGGVHRVNKQKKQVDFCSDQEFMPREYEIKNGKVANQAFPNNRDYAFANVCCIPVQFALFRMQFSFQPKKAGGCMGCSVLGRGAEPLVRTQFLEHPPRLNFGANHLKKWIQHPQKPPIPFLSPHNPHCRGGFWGGGSKS